MICTHKLHTIENPLLIHIHVLHMHYKTDHDIAFNVSCNEMNKKQFFFMFYFFVLVFGRFDVLIIFSPNKEVTLLVLNRNICQ